MRVVRKRVRVLLLAAIAAAFIVPVGFALSLESESASANRSAVALTTASTGRLPLRLVSNDGPMGSLLRPVPDAAKLILVGTTLIGLAAAVRKTI